jgi:hypothetical protein
MVVNQWALALITILRLARSKASGPRFILFAWTMVLSTFVMLRFRDPQGRVKVLHRKKEGGMELIEAA